MRVLKFLIIVGLAFTLGLAAISFADKLLSDNDGYDVTIIMPIGPDRLDPCEIPRATIGPILKQNVVETLTILDYENDVVRPFLATSWERVSAKEWVVTLRKNVKFHDGTSFDAQAVVNSMNRILDTRINCVTRTKYFDGTGIHAEAIDSHTVRFTTKIDFPILPKLLAQIPISSSNTPMGQFFGLPIGTGPFILDSWKDGEHVKLRRSQHYWGIEPRVRYATYIWRDSHVAASMVENGQADIAFSIAPQDAEDPMLDWVYPNSETTLYRMSVKIEPLNDVRVRKAINLAINRHAMIGSLVSLKSQLATQQIGPNVLGWNPNLEPWDYDPFEARRLLAEAKADGIRISEPIRLVGRPELFPNSDIVLETSAEMLREVGLVVETVELDIAMWLDEANRPFPPDRPATLLLTMHDNNANDAVFSLRFKYHSSGTQSEISDPKIDALLEAAATLTGDEREAAYQEVTRRVHEDLVSDVPLFHMVNWMRIHPRISYTPSIANAAELRLSDLKFREDL